MRRRLLAAAAAIALAAACGLPGSAPSNKIPGSSRTFTLDLKLSGALTSHVTTATVQSGLQSGGGLLCHGPGEGIAVVLDGRDDAGRSVKVDLAINGGKARTRGAAIQVQANQTSWSTFSSSATFGSDGMSATLNGTLPQDDGDSTEHISGGWQCQG